MTSEDLLIVAAILAVSVGSAALSWLRRSRADRDAQQQTASRTSATGPPLPFVHHRVARDLGPGFLDIGKLGRGRFGVVRHVRAPALDGEWAVKILSSERRGDMKARLDLLHELARLLRLRGHPHVVRCDFFRTIGDDLAIFNEVVAGGALTCWLTRPELANLAGILDVALQLAWALEAVHAAGMTHRDVKPANVLMTTDGTALLADLGIAPNGTQVYRSPEQGHRGAVVGQATDVWSWSVTVLAMLLGEEPGHYSGSLALYTLESLVQNPRAGRPSPDAWLIELLRRCLKDDPDARPKARMIAVEIEAHLNTLGSGVRRPRPQPVSIAPAVSRADEVDELRQHTLEIEQMVAEIRMGRRDLSTSVIFLALSRANLYRSAGDLAGTAASLLEMLGIAGVAAAVPAALRSIVCLEVGAARYDAGDLTGAEEAFDIARCEAGNDLDLRATALHGAAVALWRRGVRDRAIAIARDAAVLLIGSPHTSARALTLMSLGQMLAAAGDRRADDCLDHAVGVLDGMEGALALLARSRVRAARGARRRAARDLERGRAAIEGDASVRAAVVRCELDLEHARLDASAMRLGLAQRRVDRASRTLRELAAAGHVEATVGHAISVVVKAWIVELNGDKSSRGELTDVIATLEEAGRHGDEHASAIAEWARARVYETRDQRIPGISR